MNCNCLCRKSPPEFSFLVETKANDVRLEMVRRKLGLLGCLNVSALARKGGLALLWKNDLKVDIVNFS